MKQRANLVGYYFKNFNVDWEPMYINVLMSLLELGFEVRVGKNLGGTKPFRNLVDLHDNVSIGIVGLDIHSNCLVEDSKDDVYIYNHTYPEEIERLGYFKGKKSIFIKPTGPTNRHFSVDPLGYSSRITITYDKPTFENTDYKHYWDNEVSKIKNEKLNKWTNEFQFKENNISIPDNHILFIGQMPGDISVKEFSFSNHLEDIDRLVSNIDSKDPVVIKLHPFLKEPRLYGGNCRSIKQERADKQYWESIQPKIKRWEALGHTVIDDFIDIHTILPKTKLAIIENSTAGIECMLYDVPMITFGCPEYRWIAKELRHMINLNKYKNDLSWFSKELNRKFLVWYIRDYLCYDVESTKKRLIEILDER